MKFTANRTEIQIIAKIAARAVTLANEARIPYKQMDAMMDIEACHSNGCPLKLTELMEADDFNLAHDAFGIRRHIDRETGKLGDCFLPRYAQ